MLSGPVQAEEMPAGNHRDDVDAATLAGGTRLGSSPERPRGALGRSARAPPVPNEDGPPAEHQVRPAPARSHPRTWRRSEAFPEPPGASASCSLRTCRADAPYVVSRRAGAGARPAAADRIRREAKPFERVRDEESGRKNAEHSPDRPDNAPWVPCPTTRVPAT